ncbi:MAG: hypothetical protein PF961_17565 [Planctomycetota bacterium]|jgi:hypothetical protein|nr:hypothetical protein [Planctomycetota bacterium]
MTAAVAIRVTEGIVLAADGQTSMLGHGARGMELSNCYTGACKVLPLREQRPLAALCWGAGSIGGITFPTLLQAAAEGLDPDATPQHAADHVVRSCNSQLADPHLPDHNAKPSFGVLVAGYGEENLAPATWLIRGEQGRMLPSQRLDERLFWAGDGCEAIVRLVLGNGSSTNTALERAGLDDTSRERCLRQLKDHGLQRLVHPEMPIADAANLARFLIQTCIDYARFAPSAATVAGPVRLACIQRSGLTIKA